MATEGTDYLRERAWRRGRLRHELELAVEFAGDPEDG